MKPKVTMKLGGNAPYNFTRKAFEVSARVFVDGKPVMTRWGNQQTVVIGYDDFAERTYIAYREARASSEQ